MNKVKEFVIYNLDTIKIVLSILTSIFGVISGCNLANNWNLPAHPLFNFIKWLLCWHPLIGFIVTSLLLAFITIIEKQKGGSYAN